MRRAVVQQRAEGGVASRQRAWVVPLLAGLLGAALIVLAYQLPARQRVDVGGYDAAYVQGFHDAEVVAWLQQAPSYLAGSDGGARWSRGESYLLFPQVGLPAELHLRLRGWQAPDGSVPEVTLLSDGVELGRIAAGPGWQEHSVALRGGLLKPSDVLIAVRAPTTRLPDGREVGVLLDEATLRTSGWPIVPYPSQVALGALALALLAIVVPFSLRLPLIAAGLGLALAFLLLYRLQPYPYPLRGLLILVDGLLLALVALRWAGQPWARRLARPALADSVALVGVALWGAAVLLAARGHVTLSVPGVEKDFRVYATRTEALADLFKADGFYNLGYPLVLAMLQPLAGSAFLAARVASALGGALLLGAAYLLARALLGPALALVALLVLALSPLVVQYGLYIGSDMPFAALATLALALLAQKPAPRLLFWAGLAGGAAFLVRHPGLLLLPFGLVAIAAMRFAEPSYHPQPPWQRLRSALATRHAALFLAGFLLAMLPQLAVNTRDTGDPLYSQQAKNIWLAVYGNTDWRRWDEVRNSVGLAGLVLHDPARFLANWWGNLRAFVGTGAEDTSEFGRAVQLRLLGWPANWLAVAGLVGMVARGGVRERLLVGWVALYVAALSTGFLLPRFALALTPVYALAAAWAFGALLAALGRWAEGAEAGARPASVLQRLAANRYQSAVLSVLLALVLLWPGFAVGSGYVLANQPADEVAAIALVERSLGPADRLLAALPPESPLPKYSSIAHRVVDSPADARFLLTDAPTTADAGRQLVGEAGPYRLYRLQP